MDRISSLRHIVEHDRTVRRAALAGLAILWFSVAWADPRILLAIPALAVYLTLLRRRQRTLGYRLGLVDRPQDDFDLL